MNSVAFLAAFVVVPAASGVVYADATRRGLPTRERRVWISAVGVVGVCGFLLPSLLGASLARAYLHGVKSAPVVTSPYELLALRVAVGTAVSASAVLLYAVGTRYGVRERAPS